MQQNEMIDYPKLFPQNIPNKFTIGEVWQWKSVGQYKNNFQFKVDQITKNTVSGKVIKLNEGSSYQIGDIFERSITNILQDFRDQWDLFLPASIEIGQVWKSSYRTFKVVRKNDNRWKTVNLSNDQIYKIGYISEDENDIRDNFHEGNGVFKFLSLNELKSYKCANCLCCNFEDKILNSLWKCKGCKYFFGELS